MPPHRRLSQGIVSLTPLNRQRAHGNVYVVMESERSYKESEPMHRESEPVHRESATIRPVPPPRRRQTDSSGLGERAQAFSNRGLEATLDPHQAR